MFLSDCNIQGIGAAHRWSEAFDMSGETLVMRSFPVRVAQRRLLRLKQVLEVTGFTRSTLYRKIGNGTFPRPVHIGDRAVAWRESDVERWMDEQEADWEKESGKGNVVA
jgi:prophage regulatory protein